MVRNLCASSKKHPMGLFLTFTRNEKKHFGVKCIKLWVDSGDWKFNYPGFFRLTDLEQDEICRAVEQSSGGLILINWMETRALFLQYILKSKSSCFKSVADIFARDEYQQDKGNLSHIHAIIRLNWD